MRRQGDPHRYRISASGRFKPQSRRRPPSSTPLPSPPTASQSCTLQSCACRRADREVADWLGANRSETMLLLLLRGYLALRRSLLLRGGLRLCFLHHAALLAKSSGGVASAPTQIVGTAFRLLQQNEKNIFRLNETCIAAPSRARRGGAASARRVLRTTCAAPIARAGRRVRRFLRNCKSACEMGISSMRKRSCALVAGSPLTAFACAPARAKSPFGTPVCAAKKSCANLPSGGAAAAVARAGIGANRRRPICAKTGLSISLRKPLDKVPDMVMTAPIHVRGAVSAVGCSTHVDVAVHRDATAAAPRDDRAPTIRCRASP